MISIWEKESFLDYDVIIVGAGISGLSTAASLKEKRPDLQILVLERGTLPTGASTKNAGFACFGSISELAQDRIALGDAGMVELVKKRWKGLQKTTDRLGANRIKLEKKGGYELLNEQSEHYLHQLDEINDLLRDIFPEPVFQKQNKKITNYGFHDTRHLVFNQYEGQLHTGKLISSLWDYCSQLGVKILTGTRVNQIEKAHNSFRVSTDSFVFQARAVAVCTNAFSKKFITEPLDLKPGRGMVMSIRPKQKLRFSGTFHYDEGYFYFRDLNDRLIFGGGRNLDLATEETADFGINEIIESRLLHDLKTKILPDQDYSVEMKWSGIMAFGKTKAPIIQKTSTGVFTGIRLGGMGVAIGSLVGEELADKLLQDLF